MLHFQIGFGQVLAHNAKAEQLHAAAQQHNADHAGPARGRIAKKQSTHYNKNNAHKCRQAEDHARQRRHNQRLGRKSHNALNGILEQAPEVPLGLACHTLHVLVGKPLGLKAHPAENALGKTVILRHFQHGIHHAAAHQAEIPCAVYYLGIRHFIDDAVKHPGKPAAHRGFTLTGGAAGSRAVIITGQQGIQHIRQQRRRVLQVSVQRGDIITLGRFQARINTRFLAKIAAEGNVTHTRVGIVQLPRHAQGAVFGAIIHKNDLKFCTVALSHLCRYTGRFLIKQRHGFFFVITWNDQADQH